MSETVDDILRQIRDLERKQQRGMERTAELTGQLNHIKDQLRKGFDVTTVVEGEKLAVRLEREVAEAEKLVLKKWGELEDKYGEK